MTNKKIKIKTPELTEEQFDKQEALMELLFNGDFVKAIECVKDGASLNIPYNKNGWTPFMWICKEYYEVPILEQFIKLGASLTIKNNDGETPLMIMARKRSSADAINLLLSYCSNVNETDNWGFTPLMRVISHPQFYMRKDVAMALIDCGADLTQIRNCQGKNAIEILIGC